MSKGEWIVQLAKIAFGIVALYYLIRIYYVLA